MNSLAAATFLENFQIAHTLGSPTFQVPPGPATSGTTNVCSNTFGLVMRVEWQAEMASWIQLATPDRREEILAQEDGDGDEEVGHRVPRAADLTGALGGLQPAAVLLAQPIGDVGQVDQITVVLTGEDLAHEVDQVVAGARRELCRIPGGQLEVRDMVHPDLGAGLVAPQLAERVEPHVVGGNVMAPHEHSETRALDLRRRLSGI